MPLALLILVPFLLTACLGPLLRRRLPVQRLAALLAFLVAVPLFSLFVVSEWRDSYGPWALVHGALVILFNSILVTLFHWGAWNLGALAWRHSRRPKR